MSQQSYTVDDLAGAAHLAQLNALAAAIATNNSGATEPADKHAYMWWADTTSGWLKQRNAANNAWIKRFPLGTGAWVDVASAATLDLDADAASSDKLRVTGTTAITAITLADGQARWLRAAAACSFTHGASLIVPGSANYTCAAGDIIKAIGESGGVVRLMIWKADGTPVVSTATAFASSAENAAGTIENKAVDPLGIREAFNATGSAPVYACRAWVDFNGTGTVAIRASGNVSSITDNGTGDFTVNFTTAMADANYSVQGSAGLSAASRGYLFQSNFASAQTSSAVRVATINDAAGAVDCEYTHVSIFR